MSCHNSSASDAKFDVVTKIIQGGKYLSSFSILDGVEDLWHQPGSLSLGISENFSSYQEPKKHDFNEAINSYFERKKIRALKQRKAREEIIH